MGKSDCKAALQEALGGASASSASTAAASPVLLSQCVRHAAAPAPEWLSRRQHRGHPHSHRHQQYCCIEDGSVTLRRVAATLGSPAHRERRVTGLEVARRLLRGANEWLRGECAGARELQAAAKGAAPGAACACYVFVADKARHVTIAKAPEQRARDAATAKAAEDKKKKKQQQQQQGSGGKKRKGGSDDLSSSPMMMPPPSSSMVARNGGGKRTTTQNNNMRKMVVPVSLPFDSFDNDDGDKDEPLFLATSPYFENKVEATTTSDSFPSRSSSSSLRPSASLSLSPLPEMLQRAPLPSHPHHPFLARPVPLPPPPLLPLAASHQSPTTMSHEALQSTLVLVLLREQEEEEEDSCSSASSVASVAARGGEWASLLNNRAGRTMAAPALLRLAHHAVHPPPGTTLVVDTDWTDALYVDERAEDHHHQLFRTCCPVRVWRGDDDEPRAETLPLHRNCVGEYDVCWLFWARELSKPGSPLVLGGLSPGAPLVAPLPLSPPAILLLTVDTDLLLVSMMAYERRAAAVTECAGVMVGFQPCGAGAATDVPTWYDTGVCARALAEAWGTDRAVELFVRAALWSGSDFTDGFRGIGHKTVLRECSKLSSGTERERLLCAQKPCAELLRRVVRSRWRDEAKRRDMTPSGDAVVTASARAEWVFEHYWGAHLGGDPMPAVRDPTLPLPLRVATVVVEANAAAAAAPAAAGSKEAAAVQPWHRPDPDRPASIDNIC